MSALTAVFDRIDGEIKALERALAGHEVPDLETTLVRAIDLVKEMMRAYIADRNEAAPRAGVAAAVASADSDDVLEVFKAFVKGDPSLNAIRDNIRELVYYQNCLAAQRRDALPQNPSHMAIRTLRHIYLYLRTRCLKEQRL